jgi:S-adenosylmethionine:tRNA ribosyltransferase-isomerase
VLHAPVAYTRRNVLSSELDYELPEGLIAQHPPAERDGGRMLIVGEDRLLHEQVSQFADRVPEGALVVLNDTRVIKARLFGKRVVPNQSEGAKVELLLLNPLDPQQSDGQWQALVRCNRVLEEGSLVDVSGTLVVVGRRFEDGSRGIQSSHSLSELAATLGHVPLPPYVKREDTPTDEERYQTVFSRHMGSAAAPTAGLHVTRSALERLAARGVEVGYVTLHVGAGTFRPVSVAHLDDHQMHSEQFCVSAELARQVRAARERGKPVVAIGTTVVRALESAFATSSGHDRAVGSMAEGDCRVGWQHTTLLIKPGFRFGVIDALLTNFHAPRSTLLALVYAFAGTDRIKQAYDEAIRQRYRFLSYGDAMWIPRRSSSV